MERIITPGRSGKIRGNIRALRFGQFQPAVNGFVDIVLGIAEQLPRFNGIEITRTFA